MRYFTADAIQSAFPDAHPDWPSMPKIDILPPQKTLHCPLGPIPHDESSNAGNLAILEISSRANIVCQIVRSKNGSISYTVIRR